ncbi:MAG: histidine phosphatase family protein [Patescibacteria group bacterium]
MVTIIFEPHARTKDNEAKLASGWYDVELSDSGQKEAKELGQKYQSNSIDAIFCSDLQRSYQTAAIAFTGRNIPIIKDSRLRECNYGDLTRQPKKEIGSVQAKYITQPFPNGESYQQTTERLQSFLNELLQNYSGKKVLIIGHRATQYGLAYLVKKIPLEEVVTPSWLLPRGVPLEVKL